MSSFGKSQFQRSQQSFDQTKQAVLDLQRQQTQISAENQKATLADRDRAISNLRSRLGLRSPNSQETFDQLSTDFTDTPFSRILNSSIEGTLKNPDVISKDQISQFGARAREAASTSVADALRSANTSNSQRGVQGGITQGTEQDLLLQGTAQATGQIREFETEAAQARASNLATAQQLGVSLESARFQANSQRLQTLAGFVSGEESRDLELTLGISEILANTIRQNPDLSGFASTLIDFERAQDDFISSRENLVLLRRQIDDNFALGNRGLNIEAQSAEIARRQARATEDFNRTLKEVNDKLNSQGG